MAAWWHRGSQMPTVEERMAYLEGRGEEVREDIRDLRGDMRDLRTDMRDLRSEMNRRFEAVDTKFTWVIGIQVTMLVMMAGVLVGLYFR